MKQMAVPIRHPSLIERLFGVSVAAGLLFIGAQCFAAGEYGFSLFGLLFIVLAAISLRLAVRE